LRTLTHSNPANCSRCRGFYPIFTAAPNARSLSTAGCVQILSGGPKRVRSEPKRWDQVAAGFEIDLRHFVSSAQPRCVLMRSQCEHNCRDGSIVHYERSSRTVEKNKGRFVGPFHNLVNTMVIMSLCKLLFCNLTICSGARRRCPERLFTENQIAKNRAVLLSAQPSRPATWVCDPFARNGIIRYWG
jgi:hypothetical protein